MTFGSYDGSRNFRELFPSPEKFGFALIRLCPLSCQILHHDCTLVIVSRFTISRTLWSAVIKSPNFSVPSTTSPVRLLARSPCNVGPLAHTSQFRSFGKWVSKLCSLKFWIFYSSCRTFRIWAFLRNLCGHKDFRYLARSVGSRTTESVNATRGSTTQDGTDAIHGCRAMLFFSHGSKQNGHQGVLWSHVSWACAQSVRCHVPWYAVCSACFVPQNIPSQPTRCMSKTLQATCFAPIPKRSLALNSVRAQQTFVAKVTVCRHVVSQQTFVLRSWPLPCTHHAPWDHKHQACSSRKFLDFLWSSVTTQEHLAIDHPFPSCLNLRGFGPSELLRHFEKCLDVSRFDSPKLLGHFEYLVSSSFGSPILWDQSWFLVTLGTFYSAFSMLKTNCLQKWMTDCVQQEVRNCRSCK